MLIPKPILLKKRHEERQRQLSHYGRVSPHDEDEETNEVRLVAAQHDEEEEFDFGEILVHQVLHFNSRELCLYHCHLYILRIDGLIPNQHFKPPWT